MTDEGLHEVQLNGKQLVFLFMVGTVIAVVIFLCGVLVGRGLRPAPPGVDVAAVAPDSAIDPTQAVQATPRAAVAVPGAPVSAQEDLTYAERLGSATPTPENLRERAKPVAEPAVKAPVTVPAPVVRPPAAAAVTRDVPPPAAKTAPEPGASEQSRRGFVVQVMAVNLRTEADAVARRLAAKGYPAFVTTTGAGTNVTYRVRVGKYDTQREAETISTRLQKEEQFKPWVTR